MKRMTVFAFMLLFAIIFILSFMPGIRDSSFYRFMNTGAQIGLGLSILLFFLVPGKRKHN